MTYLEFTKKLKENHDNWLDVKITHTKGGYYNHWYWDGKCFSLGACTITADDLFDDNQCEASVGTFHIPQTTRQSLTFKRSDHVLKWSERDGVTVTHDDGYIMVPTDADVLFIKEKLA